MNPSLTMVERVLLRMGLLPTPVMDAFAGVLAGRLLALAVRRGLFEALARERLTAAELAARTTLDPRGVQLALDAFCLTGYCVRRSGRYGLTRRARRWLLRDSPHSLTHLVNYFETLYPRWEGLESALEHGAPARPYFAAFTAEDWRTYALGMRDLARLLLPRVVRALTANRDARSLLDIGGSHGLYALACCERIPGLHATVIDFAEALVWADTTARDAGLRDRVTLTPGDMLRLALPGGQDIVLLFNVVHGLTAAENEELITRCRRALNEGGRLFILDQFSGRSGGSRLSRFLAAMVGLNLLSEAGGSSYSVDEIRRWCAGFSAVRRRRLGLPGVSLIEAVADRPRPGRDV